MAKKWLFILCFILLQMEMSQGTSQEAYVRNEKKLWPEGEVFYKFETHANDEFSDEHKEQIREEMEILTSKLAPGCINFIELKDEADAEGKGYMSFHPYHKKGKCSCDLGRAWDKEKGEYSATNLYLSKNDNCFTKGIPLHEILHGLGAVHEQARADRNHFISIKLDNLEEDAKLQFKINDSYTETVQTPYDFNSIMHYEGTRGQKEKDLPVLEMKPEFSSFGNLISKDKKFYPSAVDVVELSKMYNCPVHPDIKEEYLEYYLKITEMMVNQIEKCIDAKKKDCLEPNVDDEVTNDIYKYKKHEAPKLPTLKEVVDEYTRALLIEQMTFDEIEKDIFSERITNLEKKWEKLNKGGSTTTSDSNESKQEETSSGTEAVE